MISEQPVPHVHLDHLTRNGEHHPLTQVDHPIGSPFQVVGGPQQIIGAINGTGGGVRDNVFQPTLL